MARLPGTESFGERPVPRPAGGIASADVREEGNARVRAALAGGQDGAKIGNALIDVSKVLENEQEKLDDLRAEAAVNRAKEQVALLEHAEDGFASVRGEAAVAKPVVNDYRARLQLAISGIEESLSPAQKEIFRRRVEPVQGVFQTRVIKHVVDEGARFAEDTAKHTIALERDAIVENWDNPALVAASATRIDYALDGEARRAGWSSQRLEAEKIKLMSGIDFSVVDRLLANRQDKDAAEYYARAKVEGNLDPDVAAKIERSLTLAAERNAAQAEAELKRDNAIASSGLEIAVHRGQAGYAAIEEAFRSGMITPPKRVELTKYLDDEQKKAAKKAQALREQIGKVTSAIEGRGFLDFRSDGDRKAVDVFYSSVVAPLITRAGMPPEAAAQTVVDFSARTGIIPGQVRQSLRGALRAGKPEDKVSAADLLDRLKSANPQVLNDFTEEDIRLGNTIATYVRSGMAAPQAVARAEASLNVPEAERAVRAERFKEDKLEQKGEKWLKSEATGFRFLGPSLPGKLPDALVGEFERLTREEFIRTGEIESARKTALDQMRQVWGVTRIGKEPRWMKYAPEAVYGVPGDDGKWIKDQLTAEVKGYFPTKPNLTLAADSLTAREERPSYVVLNEVNGALEPVWGRDGKPMRFRPEFRSSPAGAKQRALRDAEKREAQLLLGSPDAKRVVTGTIRR